MKAKFLRRFSPLLVLFVVACNLDKSTNSDSGAEGYASFAPRIVSIGALDSADTVHLRVHLDSLNGSTVLDSLDIPDSVHSATLSGIPVGRRWVLKVFGTKKGDTAWSGTDTGTFLAAGSVTHGTSSGTVLVRNCTAKPAITRHDTAIASSAPLYVGDTLVLTAPTTSASVAFTTDGSAPNCSIVSDSMIRHVPVTSVAALSLKVVACQDGRWNSSAQSRSWTPVRHDAILLGTALDTTSGTTLGWNDAIVLAATNDLTISWTALVLADTTIPTAAAWAELDQNGTTGVASSIDTAIIHKLVRSRLRLSDTAGRVLVKACVNRNSKPVDSIRFWWKIRMPVAPKPVVSLALRDSANLAFTWPVVDSTKGTKVWVDTHSGSWSRVLPQTGPSLDSLPFAGLASGKTVHIKLVGVDSASGRESDTVYDSGTTVNPPAKAGFTVVNTNTKTGEVTLTLDAATLKCGGTTWKVGWVASGGTVDYTAGTLDTAKYTWTSIMNAATIQIGVRATRDGSSKDSLVALVVERTNGIAPNPMQGLALRHRDSSSLTWSWTQVAGRQYRVYYRSDAAFASSSDTASRSNVAVGAVDSFRLSGLEPGKVVWIGGVALSGANDSSGGDAAPSYSSGDTTLLVPPTPAFAVSNSDTAKGTATWTLSNYDAKCAWSYGTGVAASSLSWRSVSSGAFTLDSLDGAFYFAVKAERNGYTKQTVTGPKTFKYTNNHVPAAPAGLAVSARDTASITWTWTGVANHAYRVFWATGVKSTSGLTDTGSVTGSTTLDAGTHTWSISGLSSGVGVAMAVQTVVAPDSTGGASSLAPGYGATQSICDAVSSLTASLTSANQARFTWTDAAVASYEYSFDGGTTIAATTSATATYTGSGADVTIQVRAVNSDGVHSAWRTGSFHIPQLKTLTRADWQVWYAGLSGVVRYTDTVATAQADTIRIVDSFATAVQDSRTVLKTKSVQSITVDTSKLGAYPRIYLQYRWANGDTTALTGIAMNYAVPQAPGGITFTVATGATTDTLSATGLQSSAAWSTYCKIHSLANGWEDFAGRAVGSNLATAVYGNGTDSLKTFLVFSGSAAHPDTTTYSVPVAIDHRGTASVTYQNTSTGTIRTTRINGRTWMAENLNYDIPNDTLDLCNSASDPDCSKFGRLYSLSEALAMSGGATCDLIKNAIGDNSCTFTKQGVCPSGWHVPDSADWKSLNEVSGAVQNRFFSGTWQSTSGADTTLVDPYGLNILPALGCDRPNHGDATCRTSLSSGVPYYSRTTYGSQAVQGGWFNYNGLNSNSGWDNAVWYFNPSGSIVSYYPVRCIRDE